MEKKEREADQDIEDEKKESTARMNKENPGIGQNRIVHLLSRKPSKKEIEAQLSLDLSVSLSVSLCCIYNKTSLIGCSGHKNIPFLSKSSETAMKPKLRSRTRNQGKEMCFKEEGERERERGRKRRGP